jgi:hypothetical protein
MRRSLFASFARPGTRSSPKRSSSSVPRGRLRRRANEIKESEMPNARKAGSAAVKRGARRK